MVKPQTVRPCPPGHPLSRPSTGCPHPVYPPAPRRGTSRWARFGAPSHRGERM